jgi:hypothetical protein
MADGVLDAQGKPFRERKLIATRIWKWARNNWRGAQIAISLGALVVAVCSLAVAGWSLSVSRKNSELTHRLAKLDLWPQFKLQTLLKSTGKVEPCWWITNTGPVDACQVKVQLVKHFYSPSRRMMEFSVAGSEETAQFPKIAPQGEEGRQFPKDYLDVNDKVLGAPQHRMIEIRLTYRRGQDLAERSESAYYFVNPDGLWVPEASASLNGELHDSMRAALEAAHRLLGSSWPELIIGDRLHPNP